MKLKRSERMVVISNYLINNPYQLTSLNTFAERYEAAKSSISEDVAIIKKAFEESQIGEIETVTGASGGVMFTPTISDEDARSLVEDLCKRLSESDRILPGGYLYLSDLLSTPSILKNVGRIIASAFKGQKIDAVMTVATKGVPLANAVADVLNIPFVIVRRDSKITEGATVSINYVSGSSSRVEKMELYLAFFHSYDDFYRIVSESKAWINGKAYNTKTIYSSFYSKTGLSMITLEISMGNTKIGNLPNHLNIKIQI